MFPPITLRFPAVCVRVAPVCMVIDLIVSSALMVGILPPVGVVGMVISSPPAGSVLPLQLVAVPQAVLVLPVQVFAAAKLSCGANIKIITTRDLIGYFSNKCWILLVFY